MEGMQFPRSKAPNNTALWPVASASKSLASTEIQYSNSEREAMDILHGLEKFHHYCFVHGVNMLTDHKPHVAILKKR